MRRSQSTKEAHSIVIRILLETTIAIISEERHSRTLYEAAKTIGGIYVTCGLHDEARKVLDQIHRQIVSKSYTSSGKLDFKIDPSVGRGSYVFLVTFEETILSSYSISYSKIMVDLLTETILYESYSRCLKSEKNVEALLCTGARLYAFLVKKSRKEQVTIMQEQLHKTFLKKWGSQIKTRNEISITFVVSLLQVLGNSTENIEIDHAACKSSNEKVRELMISGHFKEAYEVALCAFQFLEHRGAYHHLQNVGYGFKLSAYLASRGIRQLLENPIDPELRAKMLELSRNIIREVLKACKDSEISFVRLNIEDLNDLIGLLGEQQNYADLEVRRSNIALKYSSYLTIHFSGSSNPSGLLEMTRKNGHTISLLPSVNALSKPVFSAATAPKPLTSARTYTTTSGTSGAHSTPRPLRCPISSLRSTPPPVITEKR